MDIHEMLYAATQVVKRNPTDFLHKEEVRVLFRSLDEDIKNRTEDSSTLSIAIPARFVNEKKVKWLPLKVKKGKEHGEDAFIFDWFTIPEGDTDIGTDASAFVTTLATSLDSLVEEPKLSSEEARAIKEKYPSGTKVRLVMMLDNYAPQPGDYTVDFTDDAGQLHLKEIGLALIPGVDLFEVIEG